MSFCSIISLFSFLQFVGIRKKSVRPPVMMTCHHSCGSAMTADYRLFCTCPILFFHASPQVVSMLPYFRNAYDMGHFYLQTEAPLIPSTTPSMPCRGGIFGTLAKVSADNENLYTKEHTKLICTCSSFFQLIIAVRSRSRTGSGSIFG